jgi:hypothetical protein
MRRQLSAAFREHLVDAYVDVTSLFLAMEANKTGRVLAPVSQYEGKLAVGTLYASKRLIDTDPNTVRAFVAGWIETIDFIRTHKAETVESASAPGKFSAERSPPICQSCNRPSSTFHNGASVHERCHRRYCLATAGGLRYPNPPYR